MEDCCTAAEEDWETAGICGEATVVDAFRIETLGCAGVVDTDTELALVADVGEGALAFFKASSSGLGAAGTVPALLTGLGSRLMTGVAELDVGKGAARRLLKVVVEVVAVEPAEGAGRVEVVAEGETVFSGSGAGVSRTFCILLIPAFFSSSRSLTVTV